MKHHILPLLLAVAFLAPASLNAQEPEIDSLAAVRDSIINELKAQVQDLQLREIEMKAQIEKSGDKVRTDSIRKARIDSLRAITEPVPLIVEEDTLFSLYARRGGVLPEARVNAARQKIMSLSKRLSMFTDSIYIFESDFSTDIMADKEVIISITDEDGLWQNTTRQKLAEEYRATIDKRVKQLHSEYGLQKKLTGLLIVVILIVVQAILIRLILWVHRRWKMRAVRWLLRRTKPLSFKDYEVLNLHRQAILFLFTMRVVRAYIVLLLLFITIPLAFSAFPETKRLAFTIVGYVWDPITSIFYAIIGYLPDLFKIIVIIICFRYLVRGFRYLAGEVESGNLKITGFYPDWAQPSFYIIRMLCYAFMFVMIWPLLPNSNSEVFQGISVFIGLIVSLGSTSIIGNLIAGLVMTYMRPFHIGDFIRYGEVEGYVIEKTVLVTRIRTRKNDVITIPNSNLMSSQTSNYSYAAKNFGIIVHTKVTIGYDEPWEKISQLLIAAAEATPGITKKPKPFVVTTKLDDFYVEYEINAYTHDAHRLSLIYSDLHHNILDHFHQGGVEIMSPHIFAHRNDLSLQIPQRDQEVWKKDEK